MDRWLNGLHYLSVVLLAIGVLSILIGTVGGGSELWVLAGILLIVAAVVKIAVIWIWVHLARMGTDDHHPEEAP